MVEEGKRGLFELGVVKPFFDGERVGVGAGAAVAAAAPKDSSAQPDGGAINRGVPIVNPATSQPSTSNEPAASEPATTPSGAAGGSTKEEEDWSVSNWGDILGVMRAKIDSYQPLTSDEVARMKRRSARAQFIGGLSDLGRAISNMYFTTQYAPNAYDSTHSMSAKAKEYHDRLMSERKAEDADMMNMALNYGRIMDSDRQWRYQVHRDKQAEAIEAEEWARRHKREDAADAISAAAAKREERKFEAIEPYLADNAKYEALHGKAGAIADQYMIDNPKLVEDATKRQLRTTGKVSHGGGGGGGRRGSSRGGSDGDVPGHTYFGDGVWVSNDYIDDDAWLAKYWERICNTYYTIGKSRPDKDYSPSLYKQMKAATTPSERREVLQRACNDYANDPNGNGALLGTVIMSFQKLPTKKK